MIIKNKKVFFLPIQSFLLSSLLFVKYVVKFIVGQSAVLLLGLGLLLSAQPLGVLDCNRLLPRCTNLVWRDVIRIEVEGGAAKAALKDSMQMQHKARSYLRQCSLLLVILNYLVVAEPNFSVDDRKVKYVIDEWLAPPVALWCSKTMLKEFFEEEPVRFEFKSFIKNQQRPRTHQTISRQLQFVHRMNIKDKEFGRRSIGSFADPHVEVLSLSTLKENDIIAAIQIRQFINHRNSFLRFDLVLLFTMG